MKFFDNYRKPEGKLGGMIAKSMNKEHTPVSLWGLSHLDINDNDIVLDVGCGGGINLKRMSEKAKKVYGLDYSEKSVEISKKVNETQIQQGKVDVIHGDVSNLPFEDETFDIVTAFETVYFWPDLAQCFGEVKRVLKPGGIFLIGMESNGSENNKVMGFFKTIINMETYNDSQLISYLKENDYSKITAYIRDSKNKRELIREIESDSIVESQRPDEFNKSSLSNRFVQWAFVVAVK